MCLALYGSAELFSISISQNRRGPRRSCGARTALSASCFRQGRLADMAVRAPLVAASPRSISVCRDRRGPRRFCGARLCEPQHVESDRRVGFIKTLGGRQCSCGSQTRAPLVAASPRSAVLQSCTLRGVEKFQFVGPSNALPNTIRRYGRLKICATAPSPQLARHIHPPDRVPCPGVVNSFRCVLSRE